MAGFEFTLLRPLWLLALLPVAALAYLMWRARGSGSTWEKVIDPHLAAVLIAPGGRRGTARTLPVLVVTAWILATVALAGPVWQRLPQPVYKRDSALVLVLDLSLSMYARDLQPSRLVRMKHKVRDLLAERREGQTGVVVFAGDAHVVTPLTDDVRTIENLLPALEPGIMPVLGSNAGAGIELAIELLKGSGVATGQILLMTDGTTRATAFSRLADPDFPISIIGIGTAAGSAIPLDFAGQPGNYLKDPGTGDTVIARLDSRALETLAAIGGGVYRTLTMDGSDLAAVLAAAPDPDADARELDDRHFDVWREYGWLAALLALPVMLLCFRRGVVAAVPLVLAAALPSPSAQALGWDDLWWRQDQQAWRALKHGDPATAAALATDPQTRGTAFYRGQDYPAAAQNFAASDDADGHYNRANALAYSGQFEQALAEYDRALELDPDHADAAFNREVVRKLLEEQQKNESQQEQAQQEREDSDNQDAQQQDGNEGSDAQEEEEQQQADNSQQPEAREEQQQSREQQAEQQQPDDTEQQRQQLAESEQDERERALEQWLRRVPDDPGGLLRRKFKHEANLRARQGQRQADQERIW